MSTKKLLFISVGLGLLVKIFLIYIIYFNPIKIIPIAAPSTQSWISATANTLSAVSLIIAFMAIKKNQRQAHIIFIHMALFFSFLFLVNYIFYHLAIGHVRFTNSTYFIPYFGILITHLICAAIALPLIFYTYTLGLFQKLSAHKKLAKITFSLWLYVSITGVMIVLMLKLLNYP
ncbi:MAG: DUF420 domain-containing protein [Halobacteriovoraceae bacterium]|nr:DUF420 domain-containing protein [Halobacteriovoraceae bacterium]